MNTLHIPDPYRGRTTTITEFAKAEGVPRYTVSHYFWSHRTLDGFRNRPPKNHNGINPHTYVHKGQFVDVKTAAMIVGASPSTIHKYRTQGITDVDKIKANLNADRNLRKKLVKTPDGIMTMSEFAATRGCSYNSVVMFMRNHGSLEGFDNRGGSRVRPARYSHRGLGVSKTVDEWARHFGVTRGAVKAWLKKNRLLMDGYHERRGKNVEYTRTGKSGHPRMLVELDGRKQTLAEWAEEFGVSPLTLRNYYYAHGYSLTGYRTRRKRRKTPTL